MATCTTMTAHDPGVGSPTPIVKPTILTNTNIFTPSRNSPRLQSTTTPEAAGWEHVNIRSPGSVSGYETIHSDGTLQSPRLAVRLGGFSRSHLRAPSTEFNPLVSPSAPTRQPGDELLYDLATEARPDERIFQPAFQNALNTTKAELREISLAIWGCTAAHQVGSDLYALRQWAQTLSEFEPSRTRTVGLVGDPGVGKSSLINSLLDQPELAHSTGQGSAGTCVVTEYRFRAAHHEEPFGIEVDYMSPDEIKELIEELVRAFRECYMPTFEEIDNLAEQTETRLRSAKAWDTLHSMFRHQALFTKEFLMDSPSDAESDIADTMHAWATDFLARRPGGPEAQTWCSTASSIDECIDKVDAFIRNPVDNTVPALWPYIRLVRIYLRASILQNGLVLVDCPALRDLNYARVRSTERYLRNCHEIFAVTTVDRAIVDEGLLDIIKRNGTHRPLRIVCTKSEDIKPRDVERNSPDVALQVRTWRQQIETLQKHVRRCEARRRRGIPGALEEETRNRDVLHEMEFGLRKFLIERRNQQVATQLIDKYASQVQLGDLKVFCVSNNDYSHHRHDEQQRAETRLELTGIVNLRKYCHSIPAEHQFASATAFIEHDAPAFIGSLRQWAVAGSDEIPSDKATDIRQLMKTLEDTSIKKLVLPSSQIQFSKTNLNQEFASSVVLPIRENREEWKNAALAAAEEWAKLDPKDYAAFCRRSGNYETKTTGAHRWNEELIAPMRLQLASNWGFFQETIEENRRELFDTVHDIFDSISEQLKDKVEVAPNAVRNLLDNVGPRRDCILHIIDATFEDIIEGTSQIENDTLYGHDSSYTNDIMRAAYQECNLMHGPESDAARKELIIQQIQTTRLFPKLSTMVERHHRTFLRAAFDAMIGEITREVDNFVRDLHLVVLQDGEVSEAGRHADFARRLRVRLVQADRVLMDCSDVSRESRMQDE